MGLRGIVEVIISPRRVSKNEFLSRYGTVRSRFLGGKDNFLKCLKQLFFGIFYGQKFPIIASIIIYKND